uniref:Uncharacterized protein n=1 Tax=Solanum tuberosum TaxID=4113 RepID=M1BYU2_SOLTU
MQVLDYWYWWESAILSKNLRMTIGWGGLSLIRKKFNPLHTFLQYNEKPECPLCNTFKLSLSISFRFLVMDRSGVSKR